MSFTATANISATNNYNSLKFFRLAFRQKSTNKNISYINVSCLLLSTLAVDIPSQSRCPTGPITNLVLRLHKHASTEASEFYVNGMHNSQTVLFPLLHHPLGTASLCIWVILQKLSKTNGQKGGNNTFLNSINIFLHIGRAYYGCDWCIVQA